jgi:sigma-54-specific transcriptional regulator
MIDAGDARLFERVEETLVRTAFAWCHQNQVQTAKALGISRNILRAQLKRFGMIGAEVDAVVD